MLSPGRSRRRFSCSGVRAAAPPWSAPPARGSAPCSSRKCLPTKRKVTRSWNSCRREWPSSSACRCHRMCNWPELAEDCELTGTASRRTTAGMGKRVFDQIVIGVGGMGSAAVCALARRGQRVLGLEQFGVPHEFGSSAASTRIFRFAYFEDPSYVPLMHLALERWQMLQRDSGQTFVTTTGGLDIGLPSERVVRGAKLACQTHGLAHEVLRASELSRRFPAWQLPAGFEGVIQPVVGDWMADRGT